MENEELNPIPELVPIPERYPKVAYSYNRETGEYWGETTADPDPLEADNWLVPAQATLEKPPAKTESKAQVFANDKWSLVDDFRGDWYSKADGAIVSFRDLGPLPETLTGLAFPGPHYKWVDDGWVLDKTEESGALAAQASSTRDGLLSTAAIRIAPLQDAVDLEEATAEDVALLKKWKKYRVDLNRIDQQQGYPNQIDWPVVPS